VSGLRGDVPMPIPIAQSVKHIHLLDSALKILIQASLEERKAADPSLNGSKSFLNEYCTIKMSTARRAGHSHALLNVAMLFENPMIVTPTRFMLEQLEEVWHTLWDDSWKRMTNLSRLARFVSAESMARGTARGIDCDAILVDCAFGLSTRQREAVEDQAEAVLSRHLETFCLIYIQ